MNPATPAATTDTEAAPPAETKSPATEYKSHPAASLFPLLDEDSSEFLGLVENIKANGQRETIKLLKNEILDGRNRYRACQQLGIEPRYDRLPIDTNPIEYVLSANMHRRHLRESQRAIIGAKAVTTTHGGNRKSQDADLRVDEITQEQAAKLAGVSKRLMTDAVKILSDPELVKKVWKGKMTVSAARKEFDKKAAEAEKGGETKEVEMQNSSGSEEEEGKVETTPATQVSEEIDEAVDSLIITLEEYEELSNSETVQAAVAGIVQRFQDKGWLERMKKKA
jgi:ParB-like chromosome segregation protein Spo0J